jgi:hypothetical protein
MDEGKFPWKEVGKGVYITWCLSAFGVAVLFWSTWSRYVAESELSDGNHLSDGQLALYIAFIFLVGFPAFFVFFGCHYLVILAAKLHRHDLLCFAAAMTQAMESDGEASDVVLRLKEYELLVTAQLCYASRTWVSFMVYEAAFYGLFNLIAVLFLVSQNAESDMWSGGLMTASVLIVLVLAPMAQVSETFEDDVLRQALNNPTTLKGSQKHFGQQFLPHLKSLQWGFRVGGIVITQSLITQIAGTLLIGFVTIATSMVQAKFESHLDTSIL